MKVISLLVGVFLALAAPAVSWAGGLNADWVQMTPRASSPIPSGRGGLYTSSVTGRPTLIDSSGNSFTIGVGSSWVASAGPPSGAVIGDCWRDTTDSNKVYCKESSGIIAQRADVSSPGSFGSGSANRVLASPSSGSPGPITLRALVAADLTPALGSVYQPLDADLTALAALSSTGIPGRTAANTWALRNIAPGTGTTVINGDLVSGDPQINVTYGTTINTAAQGNDARIPAAPSAAGGTLYDTGSAWARLGAGTANYLYQANGAAAPSWVNSFTGIFVDCSSNTCSNIANAALVNSSITLTCTGLTGCGTVALGGTLSPAVSYGATAGTATQGNDVRLNPAPSGGGKIPFDNGTGYSSTGGTNVQVLVGGSTPGFGSVPSAAITELTGTITGTYTLGGTPTISSPTITTPSISSPVFSGSATGTYTLAGTPTITSPTISGPTLSGTVLGTYTLGGTPTIPASGISGQVAVANGGTGQSTLTNHGVLLGQGSSGVTSPSLGASGQVLTSSGAGADPSFQPPVTANIATAVATTTTLADTSGTYTDVTGATLSLAAGTHIVATTLRAEIGATTGAGAFITCRLHDGTNPITSTETLITQDNQLLVLAQNTTTLIWPVTVGSTTSVKAQCTRVFSGVLFTSDIPSDSNGRSRMFSVQTAP